MRCAVLCVLVAFLLAACAAPAPEAPPTPAAPAQGAAAALLPPEPPPFATDEFRTDFTRRTVAWEEIISGGPPKDGIPALDDPAFESSADASAWLAPSDPLLVLELNGEARGYPLAILIWHEIVNDEVAGVPVALTFCPLCNASLAFDRRAAGRTLDFGTTGRLRHSDLIMYDRQTETWWQQATGEAIVGELAGERLALLPAQILSFADFRTLYPQGRVLQRPPFAREYGRNPYAGYDSAPGRPFLFAGEPDGRLPPTARILGLELGGAARAYPFPALAEAGAVNDVLGGTPVALFYKSGVSSALDAAEIRAGRDVGTAVAFDPRIEGAEVGQALTFRAVGDGTFTDAETGSTWTLAGAATDGPLAGRRLTRLPAADHFWFAWAAFHPATQVWASP